MRTNGDDVTPDPPAPQAQADGSPEPLNKTEEPPHGDPPRDPHDRIEEPPPSPGDEVPLPNPDEKEHQERGHRGTSNYRTLAP